MATRKGKVSVCTCLNVMLSRVAVQRKEGDLEGFCCCMFSIEKVCVFGALVQVKFFFFFLFLLYDFFFSRAW